jgi:hypothetical protein
LLPRGSLDPPVDETGADKRKQNTISTRQGEYAKEGETGQHEEGELFFSIYIVIRGNSNLLKMSSRQGEHDEGGQGNKTKGEGEMDNIDKGYSCSEPNRK